MPTILFLGANPIGQRKLAIGREAELIRRELALAGRAADLRIEHRLAVTFEELQRAMIGVRPEYLHISSHGEGGDLLFADDVGHESRVRLKAAARIIDRAQGLRGVLLMACESLPLAEALARPFAVGMAEPISDLASLAYSTSFYIGLAGGLAPAVCHEMGLDALFNQGRGEEETPRFLPGAAPAESPAPTAAPASPRLSVPEIEEVVAVALRCRRSRTLLLRGLPPLLVGELPTMDSPLDQLRSDVLTLNEHPPMPDLGPPVAVWLGNLARDIAHRPELATPRALLERFG